MVFLLILISLVLIIIYYYYKIWYFYGNLKCVRGPTIIPLYGNIPLNAYLLKTQMKLIKNMGGMGKATMAHERAVLVTDPKFCEFFTKSSQEITKILPLSFLHNWLGSGLLTSTGSKWRKNRKLIAPAYHTEILINFIEVFNKNANILLEKLPPNEKIDVYPYFTLCALDNICETAMGSSINAQHNSNSDYVHSVDIMCKLFLERTLKPHLHFNFIYKFTKQYESEMKAIKVLHDYANTVIKAKQNSGISEGKRKVFLDVLLQSNELSNDDIRSEVETFMFAGQDTTACAMGFAVFALAENPIVQEKVYEEQKAIFESDRDITYNDLQKMLYMDMVIKETMRKYTPVPYYGRQLVNDMKYSEDNIFRKGTQVLFHVYGMHNNPKYFPEPEKFIPERFAPENIDKIIPYSYLPFSSGPRSCLGQKFSVFEIKTTLSKIVRKFKFISIGHEPDLVTEVILKSSNGLFVKLEKRS